MFVHFIDTSVFTNIINVPGRNQQRENVMEADEYGKQRTTN